jgi:hypothetical protein
MKKFCEQMTWISERPKFRCCVVCRYFLNTDFMTGCITCQPEAANLTGSVKALPKSSTANGPASKVFMPAKMQYSLQLSHKYYITKRRVYFPSAHARLCYTRSRHRNLILVRPWSNFTKHIEIGPSRSMSDSRAQLDRR